MGKNTKANRRRKELDAALAQKEPSVVGITFNCPACGNFTRPAKEVEIATSVRECDLCGEHGHVKFETHCNCGKSISVTVKDW